MKHKNFLLFLFVSAIATLTGCSLNEDLIGNTGDNVYNVTSYTANGEETMKTSASGNKINLTSHDSGESRVYKPSSILTITIDGKKIESSDETIIFADKKLKPVKNFSVEKPRAVVIRSQNGNYIEAFQGKNIGWQNIRWSTESDLLNDSDSPKMTKIMIDGKQLYIHKADFQIVNTKLLKK